MKFLISSCLLFFGLSVYGQKQLVDISKMKEAVELDGALDEAFWSTCQVLTDFVQTEPIAGAPATRKTNVRLAYDDGALYIGAEMFDERDSMSLTLSQRDEFGNADWFGLLIDPYNAGTIGFAFLVTSAGVQIDELHQVDDIDGNWNAVWQSEVRVYEDKWVAEIKIPFSAIRFPKKVIQTWGINFVRNIRRNREQNYWNYYDPTGLNLISQLGVATGIENIDSPLRLSFTPYVSGYIENFEGNTGYTLNGGMDLKYGLNDAFTLDVTLIPDFGQVQFDNQVLNLSPFEVQFNENRQFFTEGTELFNKQGLFYSRRIGGRPTNFFDAYQQLEKDEVVLENPQNTQLINASKLSGRTNKGTGIGLFNGVTSNMNAILMDTVTGVKRNVDTGPISNYNVFVIDQNLKNNSTVTLTNTNVLRSGSTYDANVTAAGADLYTKNQRFNAGGTFALSQIYAGDSVDLGYKIAAKIGKTRGNFLWRILYDESNRSYNQNDLGFQRNNNVRQLEGVMNYNIYKPFWKLYRMRSELGVSYSRLVLPNEFSEVILYGSVNGTFRNFMTAGAFFEAAPVSNHNWFEPRLEGRFYEEDQFVGFGGFISSDYSKPFALDMNASTYIFDDKGRQGVDLTISPRFRFNDQFTLIYRGYGFLGKNFEGAALTQSFNVPIIDGDPVFAKRDRLTVINQLTADFIFTNRMGITFSLRHYWSTVDYKEFFTLTPDGLFEETAYTGLNEDGSSLHNSNFNAFTIDMAYRWVFAPGSELSFVWKNSIFSTNDIVTANYFSNLNDLFAFPATNSLSLKVLFYIDYWETKQRLTKN